MSAELKRFSESEVYLSQEQAWRALKFFWPEIGIAPGTLTLGDRSFAQALLVEAIDSSYEEGFVEIIFRAFFMKVPQSFNAIKDMVKEFAKKALKHWFKHATGADLRDPKIYENVRATLSRNFRSVWKIREQTGELTY
jgi:hypothetical protein